MNMIEVQDKLKGLSQEQLIQQMQNPDGSAPQFMILSEITRRKRMTDSYAAQKAGQGGATVAEEVIASAGVPQPGLAQMASAMAPKSSMAQNTGLAALPQAQGMAQGMYGGGPVKKMQEGGITSDPALRALAAKMGLTVDQLLQQNAGYGADAERRARRDRLMGLEPKGDSVTMPTQADLNQRYAEQKYGYGPELPGGIAGDGPLTVPGMVAPPAQPMAPPRMAADFDPGTGPIIPGVNGNPMAEWLAYSEASKPAASPDSGVEDMVRSYLAAGIDPAELSGPAGAPPSVAMVTPRSTTTPYQAVTAFDLDATGPAGMPMPEPKPAMREIDKLRAQGDTESFNLVDEVTDWASGLMDAKLDPPKWFEDMVGGTPPPLTPDERREGVTPEGELTDDLPDPASEPGSTAPVPAGGLPPMAVPGAVAGSGGGGGGGGGGTGAPAKGGFVSELEAALARAEKTKEQDKWLALAQAGLALMASDSPTLGGAIGEAGQAGLEAFRSGRDDNEKNILDLQQAIAAQKAAAAKALGGGGRRGGGGGGAPSIDAYLKSIDADLGNLYAKDELGVSSVIPGYEYIAEDLNRRRADALALKYGITPPGGTFDATQ